MESWIRNKLIDYCVEYERALEYGSTLPDVPPWFVELDESNRGMVVQYLTELHKGVVYKERQVNLKRVVALVKNEMAAVEDRRRPSLPRTYLARFTEGFLDPETARFLAAFWARSEPNDLDALRLRARLELKAGEWSSAIRCADLVLKKQPADSAMQKIKQDALAGIRKQVD